MNSNFDFLKDKFPALENFGKLAEKYLYNDSNSSLIKIGMMGETIVDLMIKYDDIQIYEDATAVQKISTLEKEGLLSKDINDILHYIRRYRNKAVHQNFENVEANKILLKLSHDLAEWFMQTYGDWEYRKKEYILPVDEGKTLKVDKEKEAKREERLVEKAEKVAEKSSPIDRKERVRQAKKAAKLRTINESETRFIIDEQLREVGWEADTENLRHSYGTRPEKGRNLAIAEWPIQGANGNDNYVDYALFIGKRMVGLIEAKAYNKDIYSTIDYQCKEYAAGVRDADTEYLQGGWGKYKVPFVFSTNGRPYNKQFETKSGVWFTDLRKNTNTPEALHNWFSPTGIEELLERDIEEGNQNLKELPYDLLTNEAGLNLRDYQLQAIKEVEKAVLNGQTSILLAMATGTGKTRTILGMMYRFLETNRFRRILFLVDRTSLGEQAQDVFKEVRLADLLTLNEIYNINELEDRTFEKEMRVQVATVQSMVKRILYNEEDRKPAVSDFDLIIIDEAHRGYTLDREMSEEEDLFRDQRDYQSKYRAVIDYFNGTKIGLTATPALHTTEIFGNPVYTYTYRQAVTDGYLVDHDAPHKLNTKLSTKGIELKAGTKVTVVDPVTGEIKNAGELEDDVLYGIDKFNKDIIVESFNYAVLREIAKDIDPDNREEGKTLIYAVNDMHADLIVKILREIYADQEVHQDAIQKITGKAGDGNKKRILEAIKHFKNEQYPSIAVTVDLLSTGIDVPEITRIVFLRRVKSRILFEQMLGRATRLCPKIGKTHFDIYDPVRIYKALSPVNTMKPGVQNPYISISKLMDELKDSVELLSDPVEENKERICYYKEEILGKLQRKINNMNEPSVREFEMIAKKTPTEFVQSIKALSPEEAGKTLIENESLVKMIETAEPKNTRFIPIYGGEDKVIEKGQDYDDDDGITEPEDFLERFSAFIKENENKIAAINIICTKPKDLTREDLKKLRILLDQEGYTTTKLNTAVAKMTNEELTVDLITLIRQAALGSHLISHEERVKKAVRKLKEKHDFTKKEKNWLDRIEKYILNESIFNIQTFDEDKRFTEAGGYKKFNSIFNQKLEEIVDELNEYLYDEGGIA